MGCRQEKEWSSVPGRGRRAGESPDARDRMCVHNVGGWSELCLGQRVINNYRQSQTIKGSRLICELCNRYIEQAVLKGYNYKIFLSPIDPKDRWI